MTDNKRFNYNVDRNCIEYNGEFLALVNDGSTIANKLNELFDENEGVKEKNKQLKQGLLFYLDIAISESSIDFQNDLNKWCNRLFNCDYEEAKRKYGDFKYEERWDFND